MRALSPTAARLEIVIEGLIRISPCRRVAVNRWTQLTLARRVVGARATSLRTEGNGLSSGTFEP